MERKEIKINQSLLKTVCPNCYASNPTDTKFCTDCGTDFLTGIKPNLPPNFVPVHQAPFFCMTCHSHVYSKMNYKGGVMIEAIILTLSVLAAFINLVLGALIFVIFVVYGIWRLSSKQRVCPACESIHIIPSDSPMALKLKE